MSQSPLADELLKGLRQKKAGNGSRSKSRSSARGQSDSSSVMGEISNYKSYLKDYKPSRRKSKWQSSPQSDEEEEQNNNHISDNDNNASKTKDRGDFEGFHISTKRKSSYTSAHGDETSSLTGSSSHASMSTLSSATARGVNKLALRDLNIPTNNPSTRSIVSSRSTEDDLDDLERRIRKMKESLAKLQGETADLNKETDEIKQVSRGLRSRPRDASKSSQSVSTTNNNNNEISNSLVIYKSPSKETTSSHRRRHRMGRDHSPDTSSRCSTSGGDHESVDEKIKRFQRAINKSEPPPPDISMSISSSSDEGEARPLEGGDVQVYSSKATRSHTHRHGSRSHRSSSTPSLIGVPSSTSSVASSYRRKKPPLPSATTTTTTTTRRSPSPLSKRKHALSVGA